jgi:hypothetical protein
VAAIANDLVIQGHFMMAVWVLLCFGGYLRPSDAFRLRRQDFVPPIAGVSSSFWCLVLNTSEFGEESKTGVSDESMIWDNVETAWMGHIFAAIQEAGPKSELVFNFTYPELVDKFHASVARLGLPAFVPYQLRHSGPSWDKLHARRGQVAIMRRGRWRSLASLARYEKGGMVTKEYAKLAAPLRAHLEECGRNIRAVMLGERLPIRR